MLNFVDTIAHMRLWYVERQSAAFESCGPFVVIDGMICLNDRPNLPKGRIADVRLLENEYDSRERAALYQCS